MLGKAWIRIVSAALIVGAVCGAPRPLVAQGRRTLFTVTGVPFTVTGTTPADFDAGFIILGTLAFTIDATANQPFFSPRLTSVNVRCFAPCPSTGALPGTGIQWRRGDLGTWNDLTTTLALVETRTLVYGGANDPWSNTIQFRYVLNWATTPPTAATQFMLELQMTVDPP